jgi:hypothetical protein
VTFKTDGHGVALRINDAKLVSSSTWGMSLSQLARQSGQVLIVTYSLPRPTYVAEQLGRRPHDIRFIAHKKFERQAEAIKREFPDVEIGLMPNVHAKFVAIAPHTLWLGSANFGDSRWIEARIGIHAREAYEWAEQFFVRLWSRAEILRGAAL